MAQLARCGCGEHGCTVGPYLRKLTQLRIRLEAPRAMAVKTWCRVCGMPVLVNVICDYDYAVKHLSALDDQPMVHKNIHAEVGGWGVHWRLDEVMRVVFPREHDYEIWPKAPWYTHAEAEDLPVQVLDDQDLDTFREAPLRRIERELLQAPTPREDLERYGEVWDENEFSQVFENLGYRPPFVLVRNRQNDDRGTVLFQNTPRLYFGYDRDRVI